MKPTPLEEMTFSLGDVLELYSGTNRLERRRAIHFINKELVNPAYTDTSGSRRRYDYRAFLEFGIANELVTGLGVPVPVAARVQLELRRRGFFLMPSQYQEVQELRKSNLHPAELREILREEYLLPLQAGVKYTSIIMQGDTEVRSSPDERNPAMARKDTIKRCLSLAEPNPRPWRFYMLLRRRGDSWDFTFERLPRKALREEATTQDSRDQTELEEFMSLVTKHPATIFFSLHRLESNLRSQLASRHGLSAPEEAGENDDQFDRW